MSGYHPYWKECERPDLQASADTRYVLISHLDTGLPVVEAESAAVALGKWLHDQGWTGYRCGVLVQTSDPIKHTHAVLWCGQVAEQVFIVPTSALEVSDD